MTDTLGWLLVVDDDRSSREIMSRRLRRRGYKVDTAADGQTALARINDRPYDLVLLDVVMPGLDGMLVLKQVRRVKTRAQLPAIMVTARDGSEDIVEALREGANDYITKPIDVEVLLARVGTHVILKRTTESLQESNQRLLQANLQLHRDLDLAAQVQQSHLPRLTPVYENYEFAWKYQPCEQLGGDNLNIISLSEDHVGFYVLDVSGHGVHAALLSVAINHLLEPSEDDTSVVNRPNRSRLSESEPRHFATAPKDVADRLNRHFVFDQATGHFFTILYGVLDLRSRTLRYVSTGHPPPIHISTANGIQVLESSGTPIGILRAEEDGFFPFYDITVDLNPGDRLYVYSDGLVDARNGDNQTFGVRGLTDVLQASRKLPLKQSLEDAFDAVAEWGVGSTPADDLSIVGLDVR